MTRKLSYSQVSKYLQCPRSYKLYYKDRIREKSATSYLAFGSAMDGTLNTVLDDFKVNGTVSIDYKAIFDKEFQTITINKQEYKLIDCTLVGYAKQDFVAELLQLEDVRFIHAKIKELIPNYNVSDLPSLKNELEDKRSNRATEIFLEEEHKVLNIMNWCSLRRKGHLMLEAYIRDIIPRIDEVRDVQLKVELGEGENKLIGYVDAVVKFKGRDYYTVLDNKTSSSVYAEDKVKRSEQLSIYCYALELDSAGYAVMSKNMKLNKVKTCQSCGFVSEGRHKSCSNEIDGSRCGGEWSEKVSPEASTQLLIDKINQQIQLVVVDNLAEVQQAITAEVFPKNLGTCGNMFGNPCPYINLCWKGDDRGLVKLEDENARPETLG